MSNALAPRETVLPARPGNLIAEGPQRLRAVTERLLLLASRVGEWLAAWRCRGLAQHDPTSLTRYAAHLTVLLLAATALAAGQITLPQGGEVEQTDHSSPPHLPRYSNTVLSRLPFSEERGFLVRAIVPHTIEAVVGQGGPLPPSESSLTDTDELAALKAIGPVTLEAPRHEIITYVARSGDTVWGIAEKFGITPETILWANGKLEDTPDLLSIGQELTILPVSGVYHAVEPGDTLESVSEKYKVDVSVIADHPLNRLSSSHDLQVGQKLVVPDGRKPYIPRVVHAYRGPIPEDAAQGTGSFGWPVSGRITQKYWEGHRAIDIGAPKGSPIYAADSGYVTYVGWSDLGYGYMLIIDHRNGFQTLYAHLSWYFPEVGQSVAKGELIGKVGSTGRSTGPHLHFEIIQNDVKRNPLGFLP